VISLGRYVCPECGVLLSDEHVEAIKHAVKAKLYFKRLLLDIKMEDFLCEKCFYKRGIDGNNSEGI